MAFCAGTCSTLPSAPRQRPRRAHGSCGAPSAPQLPHSYVGTTPAQLRRALLGTTARFVLFGALAIPLTPTLHRFKHRRLVHKELTLPSTLEAQAALMAMRRSYPLTCRRSSDQESHGRITDWHCMSH